MYNFRHIRQKYGLTQSEGKLSLSCAQSDKIGALLREKVSQQSDPSTLLKFLTITLEGPEISISYTIPAGIVHAQIDRRFAVTIKETYIASSLYMVNKHIQFQNCIGNTSKMLQIRVHVYGKEADLLSLFYEEGSKSVILGRYYGKVYESGALTAGRHYLTLRNLAFSLLLSYT